MIKERNIAMCIILSFVTCGIYLLYWIFCLAEETNTAAGAEGTSGIMVIVLGTVTCGIYYLYWAYKQGEKLDTAKQNRGMETSDSKILYLILYIFGLGIVSLALMQNELNKLATANN